MRHRKPVFRYDQSLCQRLSSEAFSPFNSVSDENTDTHGGWQSGGKEEVYGADQPVIIGVADHPSLLLIATQIQAAPDKSLDIGE